MPCEHARSMLVACERCAAPSPPETRYHAASGLVAQALTGPAVLRWCHVTVALPPCCPVSHNPRAGSTLTLSHHTNGWGLEVYALRRRVRSFRNGWAGTEEYPAERNMEGMIALLAQMAADALGVPVKGRARLVLDTGEMRLTARAVPQ